LFPLDVEWKESLYSHGLFCCQAERVEVERLRGLVDLLRKRCDELESLVDSGTRALRNERARAVDLERRAEAAAGAGKRQGGAGCKPSTPGTEKVSLRWYIFQRRDLVSGIEYMLIVLVAMLMTGRAGHVAAGQTESEH
jgi:hypothetical protein